MEVFKQNQQGISLKKQKKKIFFFHSPILKPITQHNHGTNKSQAKQHEACVAAKKWNRDYVLNCGLQVCRPLIFQRGWKTCKGVGVDQGLTGLQGGGWLSRISMLGAFSMHLKPSASTMRLFQGHMHQKGKVCLFISESVIAYFIIFFICFHL